MISMEEHKNKREENTIELNQEESTFTLEPAKVEVGSGYAVSIHYDENEKPIIDVKTYGKVDPAKLRREIERIFPNAQIRQLGQTPRTVTIAKKDNKKKRKK
jgi:hypothetical protein